MIPFLVAEALRRARRPDGRDPRRSRGGPPLWRLLAGEIAHLLRAWVVAPRAIVVVCGVVAATGVLVALGPGYPGPVAPSVLRWLLGAAVMASAVGLAGSTPSRWRDLRQMVRPARVGLAAVAAAAAVTVIKVGLHEVTPGPVLPGPARWVAAAVVVVAAVRLAGEPGRTPGP